LALPAPGDAAERTTDIQVGGPNVALDHLGPVVVNVDGTLSRIGNWQELSSFEKATSKRLLTKRNAERLAALKAKED
ncbi:hypothetical protein FA09DRAFT_288059, partial [Tilletiopsis washingtonensis]